MYGLIRTPVQALPISLLTAYDAAILGDRAYATTQAARTEMPPLG